MNLAARDNPGLTWALKRSRLGRKTCWGRLAIPFDNESDDHPGRCVQPQGAPAARQRA